MPCLSFKENLYADYLITVWQWFKQLLPTQEAERIFSNDIRGFQHWLFTNTPTSIQDLHGHMFLSLEDYSFMRTICPSQNPKLPTVFEYAEALAFFQDNLSIVPIEIE